MVTYIVESPEVDFDIIKVKVERGTVNFMIQDGDDIFVVGFRAEHVDRMSEEELMWELKRIVDNQRKNSVDQVLDEKINRFINKFKEKRAKTKNKEVM